jgi:hypothetical protein
MCLIPFFQFICFVSDCAAQALKDLDVSNVCIYSCFGVCMNIEKDAFGFVSAMCVCACTCACFCVCLCVCVCVCVCVRAREHVGLCEHGKTLVPILYFLDSCRALFPFTNIS